MEQPPPPNDELDSKTVNDTVLEPPRVNGFKEKVTKKVNELKAKMGDKSKFGSIGNLNSFTIFLIVTIIAAIYFFVIKKKKVEQ